MRFFEEKDYSTLCEWRKGHNVPEIPFHALPQYGLVIDDLCMCFLYRTDSSIAALEFLVTNPFSSVLKRVRAIDQVLTGLVTIAKELGFKHIAVSVSNPKLIRKVKNLGFTEVNTGISNLVRSL